MAYDETLADRLREALQDVDGVTEKRMFGGLAFLVDGKMSVAASGGGGLMVRVDPADNAQLLGRPHVTQVVMRGREMVGWLSVPTEAVDDDAELDDWVARSVRWVREGLSG